MEIKDTKIAALVENATAYGEGFFGLEVDEVKLKSVFQKGLMPEKWLKKGGYSNASFDSVCLTLIPQAQDARSRLIAMSLEEGNMNDFVDMLLSGRPSDLPNGIVLGIIVDFSKASKVDGVTKVKTNGHFDPSLYPTAHIDGLEDRELAMAKKEWGGGYKGEVRLEFTGEEKPEGIGQELWKGLVIKEEDYPLLKDWIQKIKQQKIDIRSIPVFTPDMKYLGSLD